MEIWTGQQTKASVNVVRGTNTSNSRFQETIGQVAGCIPPASALKRKNAASELNPTRNQFGWFKVKTPSLSRSMVAKSPNHGSHMQHPHTTMIDHVFGVHRSLLNSSCTIIFTHSLRLDVEGLYKKGHEFSWCTWRRKSRCRFLLPGLLQAWQKEQPSVHLFLFLQNCFPWRLHVSGGDGSGAVVPGCSSSLDV